MKIIGFNASPRTNGNTSWAVNKILEGAQKQGAQTQSWNFGELNILPCRGCLGCVESGKCVLNDDMIYDALKEADTLVLGAPVYMGQMSAQAKTFTDRLFAQITPRFSPQFKEENAGKKLVLVFTQGNPDLDMFKTYLDYTKSMFALLEFDVKELKVIGGMRTESAHKKKDLHATLENIGASLVI